MKTQISCSIILCASLLNGCNLPDAADETNANTANTTNNSSIQSPDTGTKVPTFSVGDKWIYKYKESGSSEKILTELVSARSTDGSYTIKNTSPDGSWNFTEQYNSNGLLISDTHGTKSEYLCSYSYTQPDTIFPISVGKIISGTKYSNCTDGSTTEEFVRTITAFERVTTTAGIFDAYKIESTITLTDPSLTPSKITITNTEWYSPSVKNIVRSISNGAGGSTTSELSSYQSDSPSTTPSSSNSLLDPIYNTAGTGFPYKKAVEKFIANGSSAIYVAGGDLANGATITGTITDFYGIASQSKFNGASALATTFNRVGSLTAGGNTVQNNKTRVIYYNPISYTLLGFDGGLGDYGLITSGYQRLPNEVKVGDSWVEGTYDVYTAADRSIKMLACEQKSKIEPLDNSRVIVNGSTSCNNVLTGETSLENMRFSLDRNGNLKIMSDVFSAKDGSLILTAQQ